MQLSQKGASTLTHNPDKINPQPKKKRERREETREQGSTEEKQSLLERKCCVTIYTSVKTDATSWHLEPKVTVGQPPTQFYDGTASKEVPHRRNHHRITSRMHPIFTLCAKVLVPYRRGLQLRRRSLSASTTGARRMNKVQPNLSSLRSTAYRRTNNSLATRQSRVADGFPQALDSAGTTAKS